VTTHAILPELPTLPPRRERPHTAAGLPLDFLQYERTAEATRLLGHRSRRPAREHPARGARRVHPLAPTGGERVRTLIRGRL
jgi:hypothetical protein